MIPAAYRKIAFVFIIGFIIIFLFADYLKIISVELKHDHRAVFKVTDETNGELITQDIEYTDLTCGIKWWAITEDDLTTVLLPEEY
jgi:hypothetical protein